MPQDIRLWSIKNQNELKEISKSKLDLEGKLENWIANDAKMISEDLLVIGRQVQTTAGGIIDLLCMDPNGDMVIIELKKDKTPREVTAQALDYAAWVTDLSYDKISEIANNYLGIDNQLEDAFSNKFGIELPDTLNERHKILIVAAEVDESSERIIKYLSDQHGVDINAITFQCFKDADGKEYLARAFLIEPTEVEQSKQRKDPNARRPNLTFAQLEEIAKERGVFPMYKKIAEEIEHCFDAKTTSRSTLGFIGEVEGHRITMFSLYPGESDQTHGLRFKVYKLNKFTKYFNINKDDAINMFPAGSTESDFREKGGEKHSSLHGYFKDINAVNQFLDKINKLKKI